jgi:hypothetical protein
VGEAKEAGRRESTHTRKHTLDHRLAARKAHNNAESAITAKENTHTHTHTHTKENDFLLFFSCFVRRTLPAERRRNAAWSWKKRDDRIRHHATSAATSFSSFE